MSDNAANNDNEDKMPTNQEHLLKFILATLKARVAKGLIPVESFYEIENEIRGGFCNGDVSLWGIYCLLGKREKFNELLSSAQREVAEQKVVQTEAAKKPINKFEQLVSCIRLLLNPIIIGQYGAAQSDLTKVIEILFDFDKDDKAKETFKNFERVSFGGVVNKNGFKYLLEKLQPNTIITCQNHKHAIGIFKLADGSFLIRDPNVDDEIVCKNVEDLASKALNQLFLSGAIKDNSSIYFPIGLQIHGSGIKKEYDMKTILKEMDKKNYLKYEKIDSDQLIIEQWRGDPIEKEQSSIKMATRTYSNACLDFYKEKTTAKEVVEIKRLHAAAVLGNEYAFNLFMPEAKEQVRKELFEKTNGLNVLHCLGGQLGGNVEIFKNLCEKYPEIVKDLVLEKNKDGLSILEIAVLNSHEILAEKVLDFVLDKYYPGEKEKIMDMLVGALFMAMQRSSKTEVLDMLLRKYSDELKDDMVEILWSKQEKPSLLEHAGSFGKFYAAIKILDTIKEFDDLGKNINLNIIPCLERALYKEQNIFVYNMIKQLKEKYKLSANDMERIILRIIASEHGSSELKIHLIKAYLSDEEQKAFAAATIIKNSFGNKSTGTLSNEEKESEEEKIKTVLDGFTTELNLSLNSLIEGLIIVCANDLNASNMENNKLLIDTILRRYLETESKPKSKDSSKRKVISDFLGTEEEKMGTLSLLGKLRELSIVVPKEDAIVSHIDTADTLEKYIELKIIWWIREEVAKGMISVSENSSKIIPADVKEAETETENDSSKNSKKSYNNSSKYSLYARPEDNSHESSYDSESSSYASSDESPYDSGEDSSDESSDELEDSNTVEKEKIEHKEQTQKRIKDIIGLLCRSRKFTVAKEITANIMSLMVRCKYEGDFLIKVLMAALKKDKEIENLGADEKKKQQMVAIKMFIIIIKSFHDDNFGISSGLYANYSRSLNKWKNEADQGVNMASSLVAETIKMCCKENNLKLLEEIYDAIFNFNNPIFTSNKSKLQTLEKEIHLNRIGLLKALDKLNYEEMEFLFKCKSVESYYSSEGGSLNLIASLTAKEKEIAERLKEARNKAKKRFLTVASRGPISSTFDTYRKERKEEKLTDLLPESGVNEADMGRKKKQATKSPPKTKN